MRKRACSWHCGRLTDRICGICLQCCNERDETNRQIDAGAAVYVPPEKRPGHRFYNRCQLTDGQKKALSRARRAKSSAQIDGTAPITTETIRPKDRIPSSVSQSLPQ